jgi:sec-independent protein translocase protein TatA
MRGGVRRPASASSFRKEAKEMPGFIGMPELLLLGLVVLLVFGPKRLPEMGRSMGRGMREFKDSIGGDKHEPDFELASPARDDTVAAAEARVVTTDLPRERQKVA